MPNHVTNIIRASSHVLEALKGPDSGVDFNSVVPQPENINRDSESFDHSRKDGQMPNGKISWYFWNCHNWGTKWNAYQIERNGPEEISFQTAWAHPEPVIYALARMFPDDIIEVLYADEDYGGNCGHYSMKGEHLVSSEMFLDEDGKPSEDYSFEKEKFAIELCTGMSYKASLLDSITENLDYPEDAAIYIAKLLKHYPGSVTFK